jgi:hypothetical protein
MRKLALAFLIAATPAAAQNPTEPPQEGLLPRHKVHLRTVSKQPLHNKALRSSPKKHGVAVG